MSFDSTGTGAIVPVKRIQPIFANMIGDQTAGGNAHVQDFMDARRFFRAKVANITARNALTSPQDGDLVLVLDNGEGFTQLDRYKSSTSAWITVAIEGGVAGGGEGGGGGSGAFKSPVRAATTVALPANTRADNILTASANGVLPAIDGVTLVEDNRVLVRNESNAAHNGIYVVTSVGSVSTPWVLSRALDADTEALVMPNLLVFASEGTHNADTAFMLTTNPSIVLNTTALTFTRAMGGAGGVMGSPTIITETSSGSNLYNLPYTREYPMVWVDGSLQVKDVDYTVNGSGQVTFGTPVDEGATVIASAAVFPTINSIGGGAMSTPVVVAANSGTGNATYAVPGAGEEQVWKGGAIQVRGLDYTRSSNTITFSEGNVPAVGEDVVISVAQSPLMGTDALTLGGQTFAMTAVASSIAQRGSDGTLKANNHASLGASGAAGTAIVADAGGKVPVAALPPSSIPVMEFKVIALGDLATIAAADVIAEYAWVTLSGSLSEIDLFCPSCPASGTVALQVSRLSGQGGTFSSIATASLTCATGARSNTVTLSPAVSVASGDILGLKITSAPANATDLYVALR